MADRVKESVFGILGPPPDGLRVLDLFAGTGALALESLSRGAHDAVLVERDVAASKVALANAAHSGFADRVRLLRADVVRVIARLANQGERFGWIFVDPPYATRDLADTLARLAETRPFQPEPVVIAHHMWRNAPADAYGDLRLVDSRRYGQAVIRFYRVIV